MLNARISMAHLEQTQSQSQVKLSTSRSNVPMTSKCSFQVTWNGFHRPMSPGYHRHVVLPLIGSHRLAMPITKTRRNQTLNLGPLDPQPAPVRS